MTESKELCDDCISRQAALEIIRNLYPDIPVIDIMGARRKWLKKYAPYFECENVIENLPPVNPIKTVTNAKEAEEYKVRPSEDKKSCDNCKHNTDSWDSDACDGCCGANSKWSGEIYPGEFEAMEHNGRLDALISEEISREEIAALLARGSEEMTREQARNTLRNAAWLGTNEDRERIEKAVELLCGEPCEDAVSLGVFEQVMWERDVAIDQLKELGYGFGEKPRTGHWIE